MRRLDRFVRRSELAVRRLESVMGGLELGIGLEELIVRGLDPPVLPRDALELASKLIELLAEDVAAVVDGGLADRGLTGRDVRRIRNEELLVALLAADLPADIGPPDAQGGPAGRAGHDDPLDLGDGRGRRLAGDGAARVRPLLGHEDLLALLAADLLADISAPDSQPGRAVGAMGDEMGLGVDHGFTLAGRLWTTPLHVRLAGFVP
jgi:hypothetical protein